MNEQPIFSIMELRLGMKVEVTYKYDSKPKNGVITEVQRNQVAKMIDGRPVSCNRVKKAIVTTSDGGEIELTPGNFRLYKLKMSL